MMLDGSAASVNDNAYIVPLLALGLCIFIMKTYALLFFCCCFGFLEKKANLHLFKVANFLVWWLTAGSANCLCLRTKSITSKARLGREWLQTSSAIQHCYSVHRTLTCHPIQADYDKCSCAESVIGNMADMLPSCSLQRYLDTQYMYHA